MAPTIRRAGPGDAGALVAFNLAMAAETEGRALDRDTLSAGVRAALADPDLGRYYVAEQDGRVLGALMVTREWSDWRNGQFWWIQSVYVEPGARGRGLYRALYDHVLGRAREDPGVCGLRLYVEAENRRARAVYEHLGMQPSTYRLYEVDFGSGGE